MSFYEEQERLTAAVREEGGGPLGHGGELLPYRAERPVEDRVERGGEGWSCGEERRNDSGGQTSYINYIRHVCVMWLPCLSDG